MQQDWFAGSLFTPPAVTSQTGQQRPESMGRHVSRV